MEILKTKRLILRNLTNDDVTVLHSFFADPETMRFYPSTRSLRETYQFVERQMQRYLTDGVGPWAVTLREDNRLIGYCGLVLQIVDSADEVEIGYLISRDFWRQGFATEAAIGCRDYGFNKLGLKRLISLIDPANIASIGVARNVGMSLEKQSYWQNKWMNVYSIHRSA